MASETRNFPEDLPDPGWRERVDAVRRAGKQLVATRVEIFREELGEKGSLVGKGIAGLALAVVFASLALVLATALIAALLTRLFGGPIAGLSATLVLYLLVTGALGFFGVRNLGRVRPFEFPVTRDELRKDLDAIREEGTRRDEGPATPEALAVEEETIRPGEGLEDREDREYRENREQDEEERTFADLEARFRAGSE